MEKEPFFPCTPFLSSRKECYFIDRNMSNQPFWLWNSLVSGHVLSLTNPSDKLTSVANPIGNPQKRVADDHEYEVSTELTLSCGFSGAKKQKTENISLSKAILDSSLTSTKVSTAMKLSDETWIDNYNEEPMWIKASKLVKESDGVSPGSTSDDCNVNALQEPDPWKIRKKLVESDISTRCRLVVSTYMVKEYILPFLSDVAVEEVVKSGRAIPVWDLNTNTKHSLVLKQRTNSNCTTYIFIGGWKQNFVNRRNLKEGDEVGFCWDNCYSRLNFSVLNRNPANQVEHQ